MRPIKRKLLVIVLALAFVLFATPFLGTVMAGKGQEKQHFKLYVEGAPDYFDPDYRSWTDFEDWTQHVRGIPWEILYDGIYEVTIEEADPLPLDPIRFSSSQDLNLEIATLAGELKAAYIIDFYNSFDGTIEIKAVGKVYDALTPDMFIEGSFVGHGTEALEGVEVTGTFSSIVVNLGLGLGITFEGTVMGWPDPE